MDNKTHMMFHDEDVRAEGFKEGLAEGYRQGLAESRAEGRAMVIKKTVTMLKQMDVPEAEIAQKVQQAFDLSDQEIATLISTK